MKHVLGLFILFFTAQAHASWSAFAYITPETQEKYKLEVSISPIDGVRKKFLIRFNAVGYDSKLAWLIVTEEPLSEKGQELRDYIWSGVKTESEILIKSKMMPTGIGGFSSKDKKKERFYEIELDSELIKRAYIYIDFPSMVFDGGYYYSVDLGAFLENRQGVNK